MTRRIHHRIHIRLQFFQKNIQFQDLGSKSPRGERRPPEELQQVFEIRSGFRLVGRETENF